MGPMYLFLQSLKLTSSTWAWVVAYQETTLGPKLAGVRARGASKKYETPVFIFAVIEASKFKFVI